MRIFYFQDKSDGKTYYPSYELVYIYVSGDDVFPKSPKIGDKIQWGTCGIDTMVTNGCNIVLLPRDEKFDPFLTIGYIHERNNR